MPLVPSPAHSLLLEKDDAALRERITAKATLEFLASSDAYAEHLGSISLVPAEWRTGRCIVPAEHFATTWQKYRDMAPAERIAHLISATEHQIFLHDRRELDAAERRDLRTAVRGMVRKTTLRAAYKGLFDWLGKPELFRPTGGRLEYADVFPLIYLKMRLEPMENPYREVKHLLIDEMQDYTPVQYAVLGRLFACKKTILGDASQSVSPFGVSRAEHIQAVPKSAAPSREWPGSSWEIMQLALKILPHDELVPIERHGDLPEAVRATDPTCAMARLLGMIDDFPATDHNSLAIIAKTQGGKEVAGWLVRRQPRGLFRYGVRREEKTNATIGST
jgi:DNA helicase-2/ATP-dependent DNA helicase PcrA